VAALPLALSPDGTHRLAEASKQPPPLQALPGQAAWNAPPQAPQTLWELQASPALLHAVPLVQQG
jgi:hypothetical protein